MSQKQAHVAIIWRAALIFVPLAVLALALTYLFYSSQAAAIRAGAEAVERRMVETARQRLAQTLINTLSDTIYLANQDALSTWLDQGDPASLRHLQNEHLAFARSRTIYDQLRLVDTAGREILRVDWKDGAPGTVPADPSAALLDDPVLRQALDLAPGQLVVTEFSGAIQQQAPAICFATPIVSPTGQKRGIVILKFRAQHLFDRLKSLATHDVQLWLLDEGGNWLIGPPGAATEESFATSYPTIWPQIAAGTAAGLHTPQGRFSAARITVEDYPPLSAPQGAGAAPVSGPSWIAIAYAPPATAWTQTAELRRYVTIALGALLLLLAALAIRLAHHQVQRQASERQIRLSEARFRDLLESAPDGIVVVDGAGRIVLVNTQVERLFGYPRYELIGQAFDKLLPEPLRAGHAACRAAYLAAPLTRQNGANEDLRGVRKDGGEFPISISLNPTMTDSSLGVVCGIRDVTVQRETDRKIQELNRRLRLDNAELEGLNRELEAFSYSVSHDLRAPLRAIAGFSRALQEDVGDKLDPDARAHLERVRHAAQRMETLIDDLLQLASVSRTEMSRSTVDLSRLAGEILADLAASEPQRVAAAEIAPGLRVSADPRLLRILLENLLGNAWKFSRRSESAAISVGQEMTASGPVFFVRDNGVGFDMADAADLFRPFQRLHGAQQFPGTGIGLATAQRVIRRHGGSIWARSRPGEGATFYFTMQ